MLSQDPDRDLDLYLSVLLTFAQTAGLAGDHERASACQEEMVSIVEPGGGTIHRAAALTSGGVIAWLRGDLRQAAAQALKCLQVYRAWESRDRYGAALCLEVLAWITADERQPRRAVTLLGAADALWTDVGATITSYGHLIGFHDACERQLRDALGDTVFTDAFHHGQVLTYEGILAYALDQPQQRRPVPHEDSRTRLTRRERQVADLLAQGLSNKEIATGLVISPRTAEGHVERILAKLGFTSRAQVVAWAAAARSNRQGFPPSALT
jgi:DNA-binding NarL/FixJ family response regulator